MKKNFIFVLLFLVFIVPTKAQISKVFILPSTVNGVSKSIIDNSGSITFAGTLSSNNIHVLKIDSSYNVVFDKSYVPPGFQANVLDIIQLNDNGYIVLCQGYAPSNPNGEIALVRIDSTGQIIWAKNFISSYVNQYDTRCLIKNTEHSFYVFSEMGGPTITKIDINGNLISNRVYLPSWSMLTGRVRAVARSANGDIVVIGTVTYNEQGIFVASIDTSNSLIWQKCNYFSGLSYPGLQDVTFDSDGNIIALSLLWGATSFYGYSLLKYDRSGNLLWSKLLTSTPLNQFNFKLNKLGDGVALSGLGIFVPNISYFVKIDSTGSIVNTIASADIPNEYSRPRNFFDRGSYIIETLFGSNVGAPPLGGPGIFVHDTAFIPCLSDTSRTFIMSDLLAEDTSGFIFQDIAMSDSDYTSQYIATDIQSVPTSLCIANSVSSLNNELKLASIYIKESTLYVDLFSNAEANVLVSDISGRVICRSKMNKGLLDMDLSSQRTGILFVRIQTEEGTFTEKIAYLKQK